MITVTYRKIALLCQLVGWRSGDARKIPQSIHSTVRVVGKSGQSSAIATFQACQ
jgi:hypothetical protein